MPLEGRRDLQAVCNKTMLPCFTPFCSLHIHTILVLVLYLILYNAKNTPMSFSCLKPLLGNFSFMIWKLHIQIHLLHLYTSFTKVCWDFWNHLCCTLENYFFPEFGTIEPLQQSLVHLLSIICAYNAWPNTLKCFSLENKKITFLGLNTMNPSFMLT